MTTKDSKTISEYEEMLCPVRYTMDIVGGKWKLPILCMLAEGKPLRYSTIKRKLQNVTNMMLAQSLKDLESYGMLFREQYNEVPPRVEYTLTEKGISILPTLKALGEWGSLALKQDINFREFCAKCSETV